MWLAILLRPKAGSLYECPLTNNIDRVNNHFYATFQLDEACCILLSRFRHSSILDMRLNASAKRTNSRVICIIAKEQVDIWVSGI